MMSTGPRERAHLRGVLEPVVPYVDVVCGDLGRHDGADVGEPVQLRFTQMRREFSSRSHAAPRGRRRARETARPRRRADCVPPNGTGVSSTSPRTCSACCAATSSATWVPRLWPTTITGPSNLRDSPASDGERLQRGAACIGDGSAACAEPGKVIAHAASSPAKRTNYAVPHGRIIEEAVNHQQGRRPGGHFAAAVVEPDGDHSVVSMGE